MLFFSYYKLHSLLGMTTCKLTNDFGKASNNHFWILSDLQTTPSLVGSEKTSSFFGVNVFSLVPK